MAKAHLAAMHIEGTDAEIQAAMKSFLEALPPSDQTVVATATPDAQKKTTQGDVASPSSTRLDRSPGQSRTLAFLQAQKQPAKQSEIAVGTNRSQSLISYHLKQLIKARRVSKNSDGTYEATGK